MECPSSVVSRSPFHVPLAGATTLPSLLSLPVSCRYGSGTEIAEDVLRVVVSLLENADTVPRSVVEVIAKQLCIAADKGLAALRCRSP